MSFDESDSSSSGSDPHYSRSKVVKSVHVAHRIVTESSASSARNLNKSHDSKSRLQKQIHTLGEMDEELDYNEELPSLSRDISATSSHPPSRSHESHVFSPREEGEERSDDDEIPRGSSGPSKTRKRHDREEGEASSDEEPRVSSTRQTRPDLIEAEYRHRLHARHERRQKSQRTMELPESSSPRFARPKSKVNVVSDSSGEVLAPVREDRRKVLVDPGDLDYQQSINDDLYETIGLEPKPISRSRLGKRERDEPDTFQTSNQPRSYSASVATYIESSVSSSRHHSKLKKNKADDGSRKQSSKSKRKEMMDYAAWESYVYGSSTIKSTGHLRHTEVIATSPRSTASSSSSSSSTPSSSRAESSKPTISDPDGYKKHRRRINRETRESAPPPESVIPASVPVKKSKSDKHKSRHGNSSTRSGSKRKRHTKEYNSDDEIDQQAYLGSRGSKHARSKHISPEDLHHTSSTSPESVKLKSKHVWSESPKQAKQNTVSPSSDDSAKLSQPVDAKASREKSSSEDNTSSKAIPPPDPLKHYRLYSSSSEEDSVENPHLDDQLDSGEMSMPRSTLFDITTPAEVYDTLEERQPRAPSKPYYFPSIQGCRSVEEFECLNRIEEGTYGVVYRARDKKTTEIVALKRLKMEKERDGFPITSLREINTLMKAQHENIVTVREVVVGSNMDKIYLVMDYVEHDLKSLMEIMNGPFSVGEVKCLLMQLLKAVRHLHDNWILHRDLKTSNLLLSHQGILKVGDFGLAREYGSPLKHYTEVVVTLWYRAPELLLGTKQYTCPIDLWSVGCIFAEFLLQRPLFPGKGEVDELNIIFRDLGTPNERIWPGVSQLPGMKKCAFTEYPFNQLRRRFTEKQISDHGFDLLNSFLTYCPEKRITADKALTHAYFNERPRAIHPSMFPSWPARSEGSVVVRKNASPRPPVGGGALAAAAGAKNRVRYQPPAPPMGGQRFYSSMGPDSRPGTLIGSGEALSTSSVDKGFLLRF